MLNADNLIESKLQNLNAQASSETAYFTTLELSSHIAN